MLRTEARLKSLASVWRHVDEGEAVEDLVDLTGLRVVVVYDDLVAQYADEVVREFKKAVMVSHDKENGYRSTHVRVEIDADEAKKKGLSIDEPPFRFEVQLRSAMDHLWAALDRQYQYGRRQRSEGMDQLFGMLARLGRTYDNELRQLRVYAESQRDLGRSAAHASSGLILISPETMDGAIRSGGPATKLDAVMANRRNAGSPIPQELRFLARAASMFGFLDKENLREVLEELNSDEGYARWLEIYDTRPLAQHGKRPVRVGDTLVLYPQFLAAQLGKSELIEAFRYAGVKSVELPERLFQTVQVPFANGERRYRCSRLRPAP